MCVEKKSGKSSIRTDKEGNRGLDDPLHRERVVFQQNGRTAVLFLGWRRKKRRVRVSTGRRRSVTQLQRGIRVRRITKRMEGELKKKKGALL